MILRWTPQQQYGNWVYARKTGQRFDPGGTWIDTESGFQRPHLSTRRRNQSPRRFSSSALLFLERGAEFSRDFLPRRKRRHLRRTELHQSRLFHGNDHPSRDGAFRRNHDTWLENDQILRTG